MIASPDLLVDPVTCSTGINRRREVDLIAEECAAGFSQMAVNEMPTLSTVLEADELDSSNASTEQHISTVLDGEPASKARTPNQIEVQRENNGWVRRHRHGAMPDERAAIKEAPERKHVDHVQYELEEGYGETTDPYVSTLFDEIGTWKTKRTVVHVFRQHP